jgi:hypothetical protein
VDVDLAADDLDLFAVGCGELVESVFWWRLGKECDQQIIGLGMCER